MNYKQPTQSSILIKQAIERATKTLAEMGHTPDPTHYTCQHGKLTLESGARLICGTPVVAVTVPVNMKGQ